MAVRTAKPSTFILVLLASVFFFAGNNDAVAEQLFEADCAVCHADIYGDANLAPRQVLHHDRAVEIGWVGFAYCNNCHGVGTNPVCTDCHGEPFGHPNPPVTQHTVNEVPGCAACHTSMDGAWNGIEATHATPTNGVGPCFTCHSSPRTDVQNYIETKAVVDCANCHAPMPYHAKPTSDPLCWTLPSNSPYYIPGQAIGRGTFNIFNQEFRKPKDYYKKTQWEDRAKDWCKDYDKQFRNPDISFYWFPIVYNGTAMDVPAFDQANNFPAYPHSRINAIGNCGDCHTVGTVVSVTHNDNCVGCHFSPVKTVKGVISWGRAGNDVNCFDCHGSEGHDAQHDMTALTQPSCAECHDDNVVTEHVDNRGLACGVCHDNPVYDTVINNGKNGFTVTCFDCHGTADHLTLHSATDVDQPGCADCHNPNVVTEHVVNRSLDCINCHESSAQDVIETIGGLNDPVTCSDCHGPTDHPTAHDNAGPSGGSNCTDCHAANVVTEHIDNCGLACGVCHDNPIYSGQIADGKAGTFISCEDCHGQDAGDHAAAHDKAGVPSAGCTTCHSDNVVQEHVYDRGFSCSTCHDNPAYASVIDTGKGGTMVTCYDCHGTNSHHNTTEAQAGDCTFCHADPRLDVDLNAPVGQLACAECHGSNQHNNGGPIQDFGACFACHQPTPYHAKPAQGPDCWDLDNNYLAAPGKGTFNLFRTDFQHPEEYYDGTPYKKLGKDTCKNYRNNWSSPTISFNWVTFTDIFGANQEWAVPTFGSGGGTNPPPGGNDSVNIARAEYDSKKDLLEMRAENDLGDNATLTVIYGSNSYEMDWNNDKDRWEIWIYNVPYYSTVEVVSSEGGSDISNVEEK